MRPVIAIDFIPKTVDRTAVTLTKIILVRDFECLVHVPVLVLVHFKLFYY